MRTFIIDFYKQAIQESKRIDNFVHYRKTLGTALGELAGIYRVIGKTELALINLKRVQNEKIDNERTWAQTCLGLGDVYRYLGK